MRCPVPGWQVVRAWCGVVRGVHVHGRPAAGLKEVSESFQEGFSEGQANVSTDGGSKALKSATEADVVPVADPEKAEKTTTKD